MRPKGIGRDSLFQQGLHRAVTGDVNAPASAASMLADERSQASAARKQLTISLACQVSFTQRLRINWS